MASNWSTCSDGDLSRHSVSTQHWSTPGFLDHFAPAVAAAYACISGLAFAWNLLVLVALLRKRGAAMSEAPILVLFVNLHVVGLLTAVLVMPLLILPMALQEFPFGSDDFTRCQVCCYSVLLVALSAASLHTVAAIAIDRAIFVQAPFKYEKVVTPLRAFLAAVAVWAISIALALPPVFGYGVIDYDSSLGACLPQYSPDRDDQSGYVHLLVADTFLPTSILLISCLWILYKVVRCRGRWGREARRRVREEYVSAQLRLVTAYFGIVVAVAFTELPALSGGVIASVLQHRGGVNVPELALGAFIAHLASFALLPIVTTFLLPAPRLTLKSLLHSMCCRMSTQASAVGDSGVSTSVVRRVSFSLSIENRHALSPTENDLSYPLEGCSTFKGASESPADSGEMRRSLEVLTNALQGVSTIINTSPHPDEVDERREIAAGTSDWNECRAAATTSTLGCHHTGMVASEYAYGLAVPRPPVSLVEHSKYPPTPMVQEVYVNPHTSSPAHTLPKEFIETVL